MKLEAAYTRLVDAEQEVIAARRAVGVAIREERESRGIVAAQLAKDMYYTTGHLSKIESGHWWSWPAAYRAYYQLTGKTPPGAGRCVVPTRPGTGKHQVIA